jgi:hypothetical protein
LYINDSTGALGYGYYAGGGGNASAHDEGIAFSLTHASDVTAELRFHVPPILPSGTAKIRVLSLANATSNNVKFTVKDGKVSAGSSPSGATLTSESQSTVTWAAGDNDKYKETKVTLTGVSGLAGNDIVVIAITFASASTLTVNSTHIVSLIWE